MRKKISLIALIVLIKMSPLTAQIRFESAVEYLNFIGVYTKQIQKDVLSYSAAVAHDKSARKIENRRQTMLGFIDEANRKINYAVPYNNERAFKDSVLYFLKMNTYLLKDDYGKIVNLEEIAEQSYDSMEAYFLAQDLANAKIEKVGESVVKAEKEYAQRQGITLIEDSDDKVGAKLIKANLVSKYHRQIYLLFFKVFKQDAYLLEAIEKADINAIEQNKNTIEKYTAETSETLKKILSFEGDEFLKEACQQYIDFAKYEARGVNDVTDYLLKKENFAKLLKRFEALKPQDRTNDDINAYNKAVADVNISVNTFNKNNNEMNIARSKAINTWNKESQRFLGKHYPKY